MSEKRGIPFYFHQETKVTTWTYPVVSPVPAASKKLVMQTHKDDTASVAAPGQTTVVSACSSVSKTPAKDNICTVLA
jgi:hypothetical protein